MMSVQRCDSVPVSDNVHVIKLAGCQKTTVTSTSSNLKHTVEALHYDFTASTSTAYRREQHRCGLLQCLP